jgi:uncharacterized short protein YbdD (DUF466 family)
MVLKSKIKNAWVLQTVSEIKHYTNFVTIKKLNGVEVVMTKKEFGKYEKNFVAVEKLNGVEVVMTKKEFAKYETKNKRLKRLNYELQND